MATMRTRDRGRALLIGAMGLALLLGTGASGTAASGPSATPVVASGFGAGAAANPGFAPRHGWTPAALERAGAGCARGAAGAGADGWPT
jgi:hypothetical protein